MHATRACTRYSITRQPRWQLLERRSYAASSQQEQLQSEAQNGSRNDGQDARQHGEQHKQQKAESDKDIGALERRLSQMTDDMLESSGPQAEKTIAEAGFSEDLKQKLQARINDAGFRSENARAFVEVSMPSSAGRGTRDVALAQPWTGEEALADTALRMLNDAHKPLRGSSTRSIMMQNAIDLRPKSRPVDRGTRLANARDNTSIYSLSQNDNMSQGEREALRRQLKERFQPGARSLPATVQGLQSVASRRIDDAIARGLFKNIPRGKGVNVARDPNADSAFVDTTEYFMNKIMKKQEVTPPWIEKQAEMHSLATRFRGRLRTDWKRHAARVIASRGGTLDEQIIRARAYAKAEAIDNPPKAKEETTIRTGVESAKAEEPIASKDTVVETNISKEDAPSDLTEAASNPVQEDLVLRPFRDPAWNSIEASYHNLAINQLNNLTRTYNLMAPELAKRPYYNLERELRACYADVAPQLADEIRNRALAPKAKMQTAGHAPGGVLERFAVGETAKVFDDRRKPYGFKEFWRDLFPAKQGV